MNTVAARATHSNSNASANSILKPNQAGNLAAGTNMAGAEAILKANNAGFIGPRVNSAAQRAVPYARSRPSYGSTQVQDVWNAHANPSTGMATDPTGRPITWDRSLPRLG